jgi:hypothetical protein
MGQYNGAVITTAGQAVLAQAIGGAELTITKVVTSAAAIPPGTDLTALTTIADVEQTEQPTSVQVFNDNIVQISTRFSNAGVASAYLIQTLGVFGQVTGGAETLLAVSTAITPDQMPAEDAIAPSAFIYNIQLTVQSADQITVTVNDAGTATVEDVQALDGAKLNKDGNSGNTKVNFVNSPDPAVTSLDTLISSITSGLSLGTIIRRIKTGLSYIAPKNHAANDVTYGGGSVTNYGHVRLSDVYNSQIGTASQSIGASQKSVYDCYNAFNNITSGSLTKGSYCRNSSLSGANRWVKVGRLVIFYIYDVEIAAMASTDTDGNTYNILGNLPPTSATPYFLIICKNGDSYRFRVTTSGYLCAYHTGSTKQTTIDAFCGVYVS